MLLANIVLFLVVLAVLIFFHELGHFLAAKACGVYVDRFSLGMPPRVWGIRLGETDYCIGALPIGGYVKMAGQEDAPLDDEQRQKEYGHVPPNRWFNKKPVWQRYIVVIAGPLMNLVLAVLLYGAAGAIGGHVPEMRVDNRIGLIAPGSPAAKAPLYRITSTPEAVNRHAVPDAVGWGVGDRIVSINDRVVSSFEDIALDALLGGGSTLNVIVERRGADGQPVRYLSPVTPEILSGERHARFGVSPFSTALVGAVMEGSPARDQGLQTGDLITKLDGNPIDRLSFIDRVSKLTKGESISLEIERDGKTVDQRVQPMIIGRVKGIVFTVSYADLSVDAGEKLVVAGLSDEVRKNAGLRRRDIITEIDGKPATVGLMRELEKDYAGKTVDITFHRPARFWGLGGPAEDKQAQLDFEPNAVIGVILGEKTVFYRVPLSKTIPEAWRNCWKDVERTIRSIVLLVSGGVSVKELGGPLMIYQVVTGAAQEGMTWLLKYTALISVNLAIFNLLPLPVLDGGLLVLLGIEAVRGKPVDVRILERIQQVGIAFLLMLFLFVMFNDISRMVSDSML